MLFRSSCYTFLPLPLSPSYPTFLPYPYVSLLPDLSLPSLYISLCLTLHPPRALSLPPSCPTSPALPNSSSFSDSIVNNGHTIYPIAMRGFMTSSGVPDCPRSARILLKDYVAVRSISIPLFCLFLFCNRIWTHG